MSINTRSTERSTVRPRYILLGVDAEGSHHVYRTSDDVVFAIMPDGRVEHREPLTQSVDAWMAFVDQTRGWEIQEYYADLGAMLADALEVTN